MSASYTKTTTTTAKPLFAVADIKPETRMTASVLKQDPNIQKVQKNAVY